MNIVESYISTYNLEPNYYFIKITQKSKTDDVWHNNYIGEIFVCYRAPYNTSIGSPYVVIDPNYMFYDDTCFICFTDNDDVCEIVKRPDKRPKNWNDYIMLNKTMQVQYRKKIKTESINNR